MKKNILMTVAACTLASSAIAGTNSSSDFSKTIESNVKNIYKHMYVTGYIGVAMPKKFTGYAYQNFAEPENTMSYGGGFGYKFDENFRADITVQAMNINSEINGSGAHIDNKYDTLTTFANAYYDIAAFQKLTPYLSFGLGFANVKAKSNSGMKVGYTSSEYAYSPKSSSNFAWNVGAGFRHEISEDISLDIGYRFADFGAKKYNVYSSEDAENPRARTVATTFNTKLNAHIFSLGVSYHF